MRKAIAALVVAALAFGGWWIYASYVMRDRAGQLRSTVATEILQVTRDVEGLPDEDDIREAIEARARELGAELVDLEIARDEIESERPSEDRGQNQLQKVLQRLQSNRVGMSPTRMQPLTLRPQARVIASKYAVHGEIVVSHGLWSHRERLDVERVLRRQLTR